MSWVYVFKTEAEAQQHWAKIRATRRFFMVLDQFSDAQIKYFWKALYRYQASLLVRTKREKQRIFTARTQVREMLQYIFEDRGFL